MTQSITNTVNNIEQMLLNQKDASKVTKDVVSGMDKTTKFNTIFDKKIEKSSKEIELKNCEKKVSTLADLKNEDVTFDKISGGFRDILKKATDEANVETSLDLTLAKDINEIISQLKEAVKNATEIIENNSSEEEINQDVIEILDEETTYVDLENVLDLTANEENFEKESEDAVFEQILGLIDKNSTKDLNLDFNIEERVDETILDDSQAEIVEFSESIVEEAISTSKVVKTEDFEDLETDDYNIEEDILKELNIESIKVEADTNSDESLMQNQTPEEHAMKAMINQDAEPIEIKIDSTQNIQSSQVQPAKPADINPSRIIDQVVKHLETLQNNSKVNIVLNPESLGKVNIQLLTTKDGLTAQFTVATQEARDLIMKGLDGLKESLISHGVGVDNISVKVSDSQKSEYNQDWTEQDGSRGGNKGQKNPDREEKEKGLFEKMMAQTFEDENGNV